MFETIIESGHFSMEIPGQISAEIDRLTIMALWVLKITRLWIAMSGDYRELGPVIGMTRASAVLERIVWLVKDCGENKHMERWRRAAHGRAVEGFRSI